MGEGLHRGFPYIDAIVRGEGERILPELVRDVLAGRPFRPLPGVCIRNGDEATIVPQPSGRQVPMNEVPMPDYDDYFKQLEATAFGRNVRPQVRLLFETSRGCWWGEKNHCTFCGLNGSAMTFNSKPAEQAFEEVTTMSNKYSQFTFDAVDNIIDMDYLKTFLPRFRDSGIDLRLFYETKANLKREQLRLMRDSGLRAIQPGVESLSTPVLKLMRKGITALQNIRLLKWSREFGIRVQWNLLYGLPHEPPEEYDRVADLIPSLWHFAPPNLAPLLFCKFSPYFDKAADHGVKITGPQQQYLMIYPTDYQNVYDIAYNFDGVHVDGRDPETYIGKCRDAINEWKRRYGDRGGAQRYGELQSLETSGLSHREGAGFVQITDLRGCTNTPRHVLKGWQAKAFLACDAGANVDGVAKALHTGGESGIKEGELQRFLESLVSDRLVYKEEGKYLTLSVSVNPDADRFRAAMVQAASDETPAVAANAQKLISLSRRPQ
jgi:ribosomal peptide maturation radical SAM protein 1